MSVDEVILLVIKEISAIIEKTDGINRETIPCVFAVYKLMNII